MINKNGATHAPHVPYEKYTTGKNIENHDELSVLVGILIQTNLQASWTKGPLVGKWR